MPSSINYQPPLAGGILMENKKLDRNLISWSFFVLGLLCLLPLVCGAQSEKPSTPEAHFYQANTHYEKGEYQAAITLYQRLVDDGYESGNLFYNLGNSYYKLGEKGLAVLYYEKARRLLPHDADLKTNLAYALSDVEEGTLTWWLAVKTALTHLAPLGTWITAASVCYYLFLLCIIIKLLFPDPTGQPKTWWRRTALLTGIFLLLTTSLAFLTYLEHNTPQGVALTAGDAFFEPMSGASTHYHLSPGVRVRIMEEKDQWILVKRPDGKRGWVEKRLIGEL